MKPVIVLVKYDAFAVLFTATLVTAMFQPSHLHAGTNVVAFLLPEAKLQFDEFVDLFLYKADCVRLMSYLHANEYGLVPRAVQCVERRLLSQFRTVSRPV